MKQVFSFYIFVTYQQKLTFFLGFPAAAYAAYAAGRGFSGYPSFGLPYPTGNFPNLLHQLTQQAAVINNAVTNTNLIKNVTSASHHSHTNPLHHPLLSPAAAVAAITAAQNSSINPSSSNTLPTCHLSHHHHHHHNIGPNVTAVGTSSHNNAIHHPLLEHLGAWAIATAATAGSANNTHHNHHLPPQLPLHL